MIMTLDLLLPLSSVVPDIQPDFSAPFFTGLKMIASWVLAAALLAAFIVVVLAVAALVFKSLASSQMRAVAGAALPWALLGLIVLSGITGFFAWLLGLDFGFGTTFGG